MKIQIILISLFLSHVLLSQIEGEVYEKIEGEKKTIFAADVFFKNGKNGKTTCSEGMFLFERLPRLPDTLIVRANGYYSDTIPIGKNDSKLYLKIQLYPESVMEEVMIVQKRENSSVLRLDPRNTEVLNSGELRKAACCNLSESFETNATVDVNIPDGVSGAKRIAMMGLDGAYTQVQFENIPILQNLDLATGLTGIPGTWINSIQITKGTGTVVNGYNSMAGLINLEYLQPDEIDKLYINAYSSSQGRAELNVQGGGKLNDKWSTAYFLHGAGAFLELDRNNDGFRDIPLGETFVFMNRWKYQGDDFIAQFGVKGDISDKRGGQIGYRHGDELSSNPLYGVGFQNQHIEAFGKTGWTFEDAPFRSVGVLYYAKHHDLITQYGRRNLTAQEQKGYINFMYEDILGSTMHVIKTGASFIYDDLHQEMTEELPAGNYERDLIRTEIVPGIYGEYTYSGLRTTFVGGVRQDYHNMYGWQFTPRANYKYKLTENIDLRATAGRGFRVPNYAIDNLPLMANNLPWTVEELQPEVSWNFGGSMYYQFKLFNRKASFNMDYYHTLFTNQLIADRDENPDMVIFKNLDGESFSNVVQVDVKFEPMDRLELKMAYKFLDVRATMGGELMERMMVSRHRGFINAAYTTRNKRWEYDLTASVFSPNRLAPVRLPDGTITKNNTGGVVPMVNGQITHIFKKFEMYLGGENIFDFRLEDALVAPDNPFGSSFDATRVWAPIVGINVYLGIRVKFP